MAERKVLRDGSSIESISTRIGEELAAIEAAREREKMLREEAERLVSQQLAAENAAIEQEKKMLLEADRKAREWAKIQPQYAALLKAISDMERDILQMDYEIRTRYEGLPTSGRESELKKLQALVAKRNNQFDDLQCKRRARDELKSLFE